MRAASGHELIDFGDGRILERFGALMVDRPAPAADRTERRLPGRWAEAGARFERFSPTAGEWRLQPGVSQPWTARVGSLLLELRLGGSGQVGAFPEQAANWRWIAERTADVAAGSPEGPPAILNLFAHTGASTLAAARAGGSVVHVDAARPAIAWAQRNARLNDLDRASIRWIPDDALAFVRRELRRRRRYRGIVLDPPSYGHGPEGRPWRLESDLIGLLDGCAALLTPGPAFLLVTVHTPALGPDRVGQLVRSALAADSGGVDVTELELRTADQRHIVLGAMARWTR